MSDLGSGTYPAATANRPHAPTQAGSHSFTYDANGNMLTGLYGKTMAYDGENRPVSVSHQCDTTSYTYGPDGQRLKKTATSSGTTLFAGAVEVRSYNAATPGSGTAVFFSHLNIRITFNRPERANSRSLRFIRCLHFPPSHSNPSRLYAHSIRAVAAMRPPG